MGAGSNPPYRLAPVGGVADPSRNYGPVVAGQRRQRERRCLREEPERVVPVERRVERLVVADVTKRRPERNRVAIDEVGEFVALPVVVRELESGQHPGTGAALRTRVLVGAGSVEGTDIG